VKQLKAFDNCFVKYYQKYVRNVNESLNNRLCDLNSIKHVLTDKILNRKAIPTDRLSLNQRLVSMTNKI
jgi:hypothetical protein